MVCGAHLFILSVDMQAGLEVVAAAAAALAVVAAVGRNGANFSQCSVAWGGFLQASSSGCHRI
jgi:hypothetical protein